MALSILAASLSSQAQDDHHKKETDKQAAIKEMIASRQYLFIAESATPMSGHTRQLTPDYTLNVKKDTVEAYLPYFGRAFTATIGSADVGIQFKSSDFEYTDREEKDGGWNVTIKPKGVSDADLLVLHISTNGYTTLQVNSNMREMISFYGYIKTSP